MNPNFLFDSDLQMTADISKDLFITYDHRGLPLKFVKIDENGGKIIEAMRYDHGGNRISKIQMGQGVGFGFKTTLIVDDNASRPRDFISLEEAYLSLVNQVSELTEHPGELNLYFIVDTEDELTEPNLDELVPFAMSDNTEVPYNINGILVGSPEYTTLLDDFAGNEEIQFVKAQHFTQIGNEIRESIGTNTPARVVVNMPNGLGRFNTDGTELYYLKNHLGSTVLSASTEASGNNDVYHYYAYGTQKRLMESAESGTEKITETFTGKELDEDLGLYYFGARYYDADIGLWISPDAGRQYFSPYTYCANSPIDCLDTDGNVAIFGGIAGVGIGFGLAYISGEKYTPAQAVGDFAAGAVGFGIISKAAKIVKAVPKAAKLGKRAFSGSRKAAKAFKAEKGNITRDLKELGQLGVIEGALEFGGKEFIKEMENIATEGKPFDLTEPVREILEPEAPEIKPNPQE